MSIVSSYVNNISATKGSHLAHYNRNHIMTSHEIQMAVRLYVPGGLQNQATEEHNTFNSICEGTVLSIEGHAHFQ